MDNFAERSAVANEALRQAYLNLDPSDPKYYDHLKAIGSVHQQLVEDAKNETLITIENQKLEAEKAKEKSGRRIEIGKIVVGGLQIVATVFAAVFAEVSLNKRFDKSTKFEENDAFLTTTDKTTVSEGLRPKGRFKLF